jgi:hypothetical protein
MLQRDAPQKNQVSPRRIQAAAIIMTRLEPMAMAKPATQEGIQDE